MRLICPNCDAEYEVDNAAIPDTGRDVQCSSCGHAWFQLPPEVELALEQEDELFGAPVSAADGGAVAPAAMDPADAEPEEPAPAMPAQKRTVDENLMAILREEAEREAQARKSEAAPIETQTEMGLAAPPAKSGGLVGAARRIAQMKGIDPDAAPKPAPRPGSRRDMLPDIEEINSSLKGGDSAASGFPDLEPAIAPASGSGFRSGFVLSLLVAAVGVAAYVMEPRISEQIPAAAGAMKAYVGVVDDARLWLDGIMRAATASLRDISANDAGSGG